MSEASSRPCVLVVDDDADVREILAILLDAEGYEVREAGNGLEALAAMTREPRPSIILLDLMMPELDGAGFVERMREDPTMADVPVVVLSGHQAAARVGAELGVSGVLVKPIEYASLARMMRATLTPPAAGQP